jgi:hypothetical protein
LSLGDGWIWSGAPSEGATAIRDAQALDLAEQVYRRLLAGFSQDEMDGWGICASLDEIRYTRAEILLLLRRWSACALAFDEAFAASGERAREAAFGSVVCHHHAWESWREELAAADLHDRLEVQIEHTARWRRLLASLHRYRCVARSGPLSSAVALSRAEAFYEAGALWEAAVGFRALAYQGTAAESRLAARRYAEVMEGLAADDVCRLELSADLERLHEKHCHEAGEICSELALAVRRAGGIASEPTR